MVRRLVFDPLTKAQQRQLQQISGRIVHAIDPDSRPDDRVRALLPVAASADLIS